MARMVLLTDFPFSTFMLTAGTILDDKNGDPITKLQADGAPLVPATPELEAFANKLVRSASRLPERAFVGKVLMWKVIEGYLRPMGASVGDADETTIVERFNALLNVLRTIHVIALPPILVGGGGGLGPPKGG